MLKPDGFGICPGNTGRETGSRNTFWMEHQYVYYKAHHTHTHTRQSTRRKPQWCWNTHNALRGLIWFVQLSFISNDQVISQVLCSWPVSLELIVNIFSLVFFSTDSHLGHAEVIRQLICSPAVKIYNEQMCKLVICLCSSVLLEEL